MSRLSFSILVLLIVGALSLLVVSALAPTSRAAGDATGDTKDSDSDLKPVTDPKVNSPKEALRQQIFKGAADLPACAALKTDPRGGANLEPALDAFVKHLSAVFKTKDEKGLLPMFHQRLPIALPVVAETLNKLDVVYGKPIDVSIYRLWALNTVDGSPAGLGCEQDGLKVYPSYGYPLQFALWLQVMGQKEIGRIYVSVVPADGRWNIGAFHVQQWTHAAKDYTAWTEEAIKTAHAGRKEAAYVMYDIAAKLLDGGQFFDVAVRADIEKARDALMSAADWDKSIRTALKNWEITQSATLLVSDGAGLLVRVHEPGEISVDDITSSCHKIAATLLAQPWGPSLGGVRCGFNMPREDPKKEGGLGGIYVSFDDVRADAAKAQRKASGK